ncbi:MAG TPA: RHS repeat domain-containing protein, partial [Afifellaceae bacterium]|nr:RHS repeat domain-containing protein [Afifellaceae bacterium]
METQSHYGFADIGGAAAVWTAEKDGSGRWTRRLTDSLGRTLRVDEPVSVTGDRVADLGPLNTPLMPTSYIYGKRGPVIEVRQGAQRRYFAYDPFGRLVRQKLPEQQANPDLDSPDPETGNPGWSNLFEYDHSGNIVSATDANGVVISSKYDDHGRLTAREYSDGTPGATFRYDLLPHGKGELFESRNSVSVDRILSFDALGNPLRAEQETAGETYSLEYEYTLAGEIRSERYPSGKTTVSEHDGFGDLRRVAVRAGGTEATYANGFRYAPNGKAMSIRLGNGSWESAGFDASGRLIRLGLGSSAEDDSLWKAVYGYGEPVNGSPADPSRSNGAVTRIAVSSDAWPGAFVHKFRYDPAGRLSSAEEELNDSRVWTQAFGYDRFGNRTSARTTIGEFDENAVADFDPATNRHLPSSGFEYDRNGNVTRDPDGRVFVFDGRNLLTEVRSPDGVLIARYEYGPNGRRVRAVTPLETRVFVYSLGRLASEYSTRSDP